MGLEYKLDSWGGWLDLLKRGITGVILPFLALLILGPFQPFQNVLFNPSSVFFSLIKGLSFSPWSPLHLKSLSTTQTKPVWTYPKSGNSESFSIGTDDSQGVARWLMTWTRTQDQDGK